MMKRLWMIGGLAAICAGSAQAQTVRLSNPLDVARTDAIAEVPVNIPGYTKEGAWSVRMGGKLYPAQYLNGKVRFLVSLAPKASLRATLVRNAATAEPRRVLVTLKVQDGGQLVGDAAKGGAIKGGFFHSRMAFTSPKDHFIHDGLIAFEGIGWESDRVMYRLYLDQRNVTDLFGKYGTAMIYPDIGHGFDDYQYPRVWGGDIFKVGEGLGMGGLGLLRDGKVTQTGPSTITGRVIANGPVTAVAGVDADNISGSGAYLHATYALSAGNVLTYVDALAKNAPAPLLAGLSIHPGDTLIVPEAKGGGWNYIAVWGKQEHDQDKVGTVLFYRPSTVVGAPGNDGQTLYITFASRTHVHYAFAGRWVYENKDVPGNNAVKDMDAFRAWLAEAVDELDHPVVVSQR